MGFILLLVSNFIVKVSFFLIEAYSCSYNTFKSQLQSGDVDKQLSTKAHIACATATGERDIRGVFL